MRRIALCVFMLFPCLAVASESSTRSSQAKPWEVSDAERLALLLDDSAAALRVTADRERRGGARLGPESLSIGDTKIAPVDVIDGGRDPQLLFPFEVFQQLVTLAYANDSRVRTVFRESKNHKRVALGLPDDMWDRLEGIVAPYRAALVRNSIHGRNGTKRESSVDLTATDLCRERHAALVEAQAAFGPAFSEFLYTAVAPDIYRRYIIRPDRTLLDVARGECR